MHPKHYHYIYDSNNVYIQLKDGNYICVKNPGTNWEDNLYKILDPLETKNELITAKKRYLEGASNELYIDEKNRLFKGNEFITRDFLKYYTYWEEERETYSKDVDSLDMTLTLEAKKYTDFQAATLYIGTDSNNNTYWFSYGKIIVCNKIGYVLDIFTSTEWKSKTVPIIHPCGDVYFLDYDAEGVYLYKIARCW